MTNALRLLLPLFLLAGCGAAPEAAPSGFPTGASSSGVHGTSTIAVHYPTGWGHRISLRGTGPLSWSAGKDARWTQGDTWVTSFETSRSVAFKPLFDDSTWALGPNWTVAPGRVVDVWPSFFHDTGSIERRDGWWSDTLQNARGIWIYLPPSYDENPAERYPVVYMHDGQNLFDDEAAFAGISWDVGGALDQGAREASIHEAIVVGIESNDDRMWELTPTEGGYGGGGADRYLQFLVEELKPEIDRTLRTLPDRDHTAIVGSSLGGLVSAYAGVRHPEVFGLVGALSPSTWWDHTWIIDQVRAARGPRPLRVYVDSGNTGYAGDPEDTGDDDAPNTARLAQAYEDAGIQVRHVVENGGQHGEYWWRRRVPGALGFLLGGR